MDAGSSENKSCGPRQRGKRHGSGNEARRRVGRKKTKHRGGAAGGRGEAGRGGTAGRGREAAGRGGAASGRRTMQRAAAARSKVGSITTTPSILEWAAVGGISAALTGFIVYGLISASIVGTILNIIYSLINAAALTFMLCRTRRWSHIGPVLGAGAIFFIVRFTMFSSGLLSMAIVPNVVSIIPYLILLFVEPKATCFQSLGYLIHDSVSVNGVLVAVVTSDPCIHEGRGI